MSKEKHRDEIIEEVREIRRKLAAWWDFDIDRIYEEAQRRQLASKRETLPAAPKRVRPVE